MNKNALLGIGLIVLGVFTTTYTDEWSFILIGLGAGIIFSSRK